MITHKNLFKHFAIFLFICYLLLGSVFSVCAGGPGVTDGEIEAIRKQYFKETSHGVPGISLDVIDKDFVCKLYGTPGALGALDRIFAGEDYARINAKIGQLRAKAVVEAWAEVIGEDRVAGGAEQCGETERRQE